MYKTVGCKHWRGGVTQSNNEMERSAFKKMFNSLCTAKYIFYAQIWRLVSTVTKLSTGRFHINGCFTRKISTQIESPCDLHCIHCNVIHANWNDSYKNILDNPKHMYPMFFKLLFNWNRILLLKQVSSTNSHCQRGNLRNFSCTHLINIAHVVN